MTEWRPIAGYEGRYEISDDGQVKILAAPGRGRLNTDRIMKIHRGTTGYWQALLYDGSGDKPRARRIHQLVLEAFIAPRPDGCGMRFHPGDDRRLCKPCRLATFFGCDCSGCAADRRQR